MPPIMIGLSFIKISYLLDDDNSLTPDHNYTCGAIEECENYTRLTSDKIRFINFSSRGTIVFVIPEVF